MLRSKTAPARLCAALGPYAAHALALGAGGVFSAAVLPGGAAPLGLALTIGVPASFAPAAGLGALLGSLVFLPMFTGLRLTGAIGAAVLARGLGKSWWPGWLRAAVRCC